MIDRQWLVTLAVVLFVCCLTIGCEKDTKSGPAEKSAGSKVKAPLLGDVTLKDFKTRLGSDFAVDKDKAAPPTVLLRESGALRTVVIVQHDEAGRVQSLSAHVLGDVGDDAQIDQVYLETAATLAKALDVPVDDEFTNFMKIGVLRTRFGFTYNFTRDSVYFDLIPNTAVLEWWKWAAFKPDQVKRDIYVSSRQSSSSKKAAAIPGSSIEQLKELLSDFTLDAEAKQVGQMVFVRKLEDHLQVVQCWVDSDGSITRIEAFVGGVAEGGDVMALNQQLWGEMTKLKYKDSDPEKAVAFLTGPLPSYAVETSAAVGSAEFCLPFFTDGGRKQLVIYAWDPSVKVSK